jgi:glycosyltransferase involved in cell wall biosynthesis
MFKKKMMKTKSRVTVAQLGARMHYAIPAILQEAGMLEHFYSDAYVGKGSNLRYLLKMASLFPRSYWPMGLHRLSGRKEDKIPAKKITAFNLFGLKHVWEVARSENEEKRRGVYIDGGKEFCQKVIQKGLGDVDAIYTFKNVALELLQYAKTKGIHGIMEQTIAPMEVQYDLLSEEARKWEGWEEPYPEKKVWIPTIEREHKEWEAADTIVCGSQFVADGLEKCGAKKEKIKVVPYGVNLEGMPDRKIDAPWDGTRKLRVLFLGALNLRKGAPYLYEAIKLLKNEEIECRAVGSVAIREKEKSKISEVMQVKGPVPRTKIYDEYGWADVFVFPSICEGSATVIYEALSAGLPVITTPNSGSVVRDGVEGYIVPIRNPEAIADSIMKIVNDPEKLREFSKNAEKRAKQYSWEEYGKRLVRIIESTR